MSDTNQPPRRILGRSFAKALADAGVIQLRGLRRLVITVDDPNGYVEIEAAYFADERILPLLPDLAAEDQA